MTSKETVNKNTTTRVGIIEKLRKDLAAIDKDNVHEQRLANHLCHYCFYLAKVIVGEAFTNWKCLLCAKPDRCSNTNVPSLCIKCATDNNLCIRCRSDVNLKLRHA